MSELLLLKTPYASTNQRTQRLFVGEHVVGVALADSLMTIEYGVDLTALPTEEEIVNVGDDKAARIADFYEQTFARDPAKRPLFDCHLFAFYAAGKAVQIRQKEAYISHSYYVPDASEFIPGEVYGTTTDSGRMNHSTIAIDRPNYTMGIVGAKRPLVVSHNTELLAFYQATHFRHVLPGLEIDSIDLWLSTDGPH